VVAAALGVFSAAVAWGLPVDRRLSLAPGELHAERVRYLVSASVEPADLATAELLPAGELFVTPLHPGDGLLYLFEEGQLEVVQLHVGSAAAAPVGRPLDVAGLRGGCPGAELVELEGEALLHVPVSTPACRRVLLASLPSTDLLSGQLRLEVTTEALQAQLRDGEAALVAAHIAGLELSYVGATLTLHGTIDAPTRRRALQILWEHVLGDLAFDDQTTDCPRESVRCSDAPEPRPPPESPHAR
jgi:hypothetical protein